MNYEKWLENIELLKTNNNYEIKDELLKEVNINLREMLQPKIIELIKFRLNNSIKKIIDNLENIFSDNNILDLYLVTFRKDILFTFDLCFMKELSDEIKKQLKEMVIKDTNEVYNILTKEANNIDVTGVLSFSIKNNMIKWRNEDEL